MSTVELSVVVHTVELSVVLPALNESNAAGDAEQNPGPLSAMTMTLPS